MQGMTDIEDLEEIECSRRCGKFGWGIPPNIERASASRESQKPPQAVVSIKPARLDVEDLKMIAARARWSGVPLRSMADVLAALRARRDELGITFETLDAIAGWPCRYGAKLLAPEPSKNMGWQSLGLGLGALGTMLIMIEDEEQIRRVQSRWIRRERQITARIEG
jgi:hypothetical protein